MMIRYPLFSWIFAALLFSQSCTNPTATTDSSETGEKLGSVQLQVTGAQKAQPSFEKGLLLLHSFEFEDARTAFQEALAIDSTFVMAHWGEAMSHNHPLWREQDTEAARAVINKLGDTPEDRLSKINTDLEKDLWRALEELYGPEENKKERDIAYNKILTTLHKKYPDNHEVSAFYALSCLGAVKGGRDEKAFEKGALIAQSIIDENPNHPGALHYLIHSYDDPKHAKFALNAANSYSKVAPDAAHALHMPSHIYVAMGMWDEVVSSNIASWDASITRMKEKELDNDARSYHALHWLMYGYLQKGDLTKATNLLKDMKEYQDTLSSRLARNYLVMMKGNYLAESNQWDSELADIEVDDTDMNVQFQAVNAFTKGYHAFLKKDLAQLKEVTNGLNKRITGAQLVVNDDGPKMCSSSSPAKPNQVNVDKSKIMEVQLRALQAQLMEKPKLAEQHLKEAISLTEKSKYTYGPPKIIMPPYEMYGSWLLQQNRKKEALEQFNKAAERGPKRLKVLAGLKAANEVSS